MIISVVSPHTSRNGNTVASILLGLALSDLKRKVFLTHIHPQSSSFHHYLGMKAFEDKTSTPSQLVKLMGEGAIKPEDIGDFCKDFEDYLKVFTNIETNFSEHDMSSLLRFVLESDMPYEYMLFDIDENSDHKTAEMVINKSNIVILNVTADIVELSRFTAMKERIAKLCKNKKVILLCSAYDSKAMKSTKEITKAIGVDTTCYVIRHNSWLKWSCNNGKLPYFYKQGKTKDTDVVEVFKDVSTLASAVAKTKVVIGKSMKGVFK